jgi:acyl carrier protein
MEIIDEVKGIISKSLKVPVEQLTDDSTLEKLGAESIDVIEMVFQLEDRFNVDISVKAKERKLMVGDAGAKNGDSPGDLGSMTIGQIANSVKSLVEAKGA